MSDYDPQRALITKIAVRRDLKLITKHKVTTETFLDEELREVFAWQLEKFKRHGRVPSLDLLQAHFPDFEPERSGDKQIALIEAVKERKLYTDLQGSIKRVAAETRLDPKDGLETLKTEAANLSMAYSGGSAENLIESGRKVLRTYAQYKKSKGVIGIPWPWDRLNKSTRGIRRGSLNVLYGPAGTFKTWLLLVIADFAHEMGYRPIFFTYEMPVEDIRTRWGAYKAKVDYERYSSGKLSPREERRLNRKMAELGDDLPFIVEELESSGDAALIEVRSKVHDTQADLTLLDGLAFLADDVEWKSWGHVCKSIKTLARTSKVPIVTTHHANADRKKAKVGDNDATDVALGDALSRAADVMIRLWRTVENEAANEVGLVTRKVREGKKCSLVLNAVPAIDFSQKLDSMEGDSEGPVEKKAGSDDLYA